MAIGGRRFKIRHGVGLVAFVMLAAGGVRFGPLVRDLCRSTDRFIAWPSDPRVHYEPGAEVMAAEVAAALPAAMRTVEERQYRPFAKPPAIYVCATLATYGSYGGSVQSGGYVVNERLFISPKPENTAERVPRLLTHELSHLHLEKQVGTVSSMARFPVWFQEGLAALVSGGAGAENVSEEEATRALAEGRAFVPEATGGLFHRSSASTYGLTPHLFYREGAMFLGNLERRDAARFRRFLVGIEDGQSLEGAFDAAFEETLASAWARFVADAKAHVAP